MISMKHDIPYYRYYNTRFYKIEIAYLSILKHVGYCYRLRLWLNLLYLVKSFRKQLQFLSQCSIHYLVILITEQISKQHLYTSSLLNIFIVLSEFIIIFFILYIEYRSRHTYYQFISVSCSIDIRFQNFNIILYLLNLYILNSINVCSSHLFN